MPKAANPTDCRSGTIVTLGDVAENSTFATQAPREDGYVRYVIGKHIPGEGGKITTWNEVGDGDFGSRIRTIIKEGDIVCTTRGPKLRVAVATFDCLSAHTNFILRTKNSSILLQEFLQAIACSDDFQEHLRVNFRGSTNLFVNWSDAAKFEFLLPPIPEQARIVRALLAFDQAIDSAEAVKKTALSAWRSLSKEEFSARAGHGERLSRYYSIASGQEDPKDQQFADLPLVGPNHVESITGVFLGAESARAQGAISGKYFFRSGSVIYSKIRPELRKAILSNFEGLCSADMYPLIAEPDLLPEYLLDLVLSDAFSSFAISCSMRTGMPKLNREQLDQFLFDLPSLDHQSAYLNTASNIKKCLDAVSSRLIHLTGMRRSILYEI